MTILTGYSVSLLLLSQLGASQAFVIPAAISRSNNCLASLRQGPGVVAASGTVTTPLTTTATASAAQHARRRRRSRATSALPVSSSSSNRQGGARSGGLRMSTDDGSDGAIATPVDAELSTPSAAGGSGGGGGEAGDPVTRGALKQKLLRKVATLNRGFVAQESDRLDVEEIVEMLEMENPNPKACEGFASGSSPLAGRWQLLYTTSLDVLSLQINPAVTVGQIFQEIEEDGRAIRNIIELQPPFASVNKILGSSMATLTVKLETDPVSDSRINLKFVRTEIKADSIFGRKLDLPTLGVNLPSPETFENILPKSGGGAGGAERLTGKLEDARKRARDLAQKAKDKRNTLKKTVEEKLKGDGGGTSGKSAADGDGEGNGQGQDAAAATKEVREEGEKEEGEKEEGGGEEGEAEVPPPVAAKGEESSGEAGASPGDGGAASLSSFSSRRVPYFESTYCDEDLRVGRTGQGDIFISVRV